MPNNWFERSPHVFLLGILLVSSYFLLMFGNNLVSLTHPDEVFYIQSAKEMLAHKSWLTPMIFDDVQFEKPFLSFALFAWAIKMFGLTPFAGRFWPSAFGILGVGTVYWISWILFKRKRLSFLAGLVLASSFIYLALSRAVLTDMIFTGFVSISIGFFALAYYNRQQKTLGILGWLAFMAIAVLTKGLLGICFAGFVAVAFLVYKRETSFLMCPATAWGILLFLALALPWHILMYINHGSLFLKEYFYNVHWRRILESEHRRLDNWYFYIMLLFVGVMPWFLFWINSAYSTYQQFRKNRPHKDQIFFLCAWILGIYIFTQPAHSKLASYIFPAFPAVAILIAFGIHEAIERAQKGETPRLFKICAYGMSVFLGGVSVGGIVAANKYRNIIIDMTPVYIAAGILCSVAFLIFLFNKTRRYTAMTLSYVGVTATLLVALFFARPFIEPWVSCKDITDAFAALETGEGPVLSSKFYVRGVRFYTNRDMAVIDINGKRFWSPHPIPFLDKDSMVVDFLNQRDVTWAVVKDGNVKDLKRILSSQKFRITELDGIGGKYILKIERIG